MAKAKKVAYVVFRGYTPGVYRNWVDVKEQTDGYKNAHHRGYTIDQGGIQKAEADFKSFLATNRRTEDAAARSQYSSTRDGFQVQGSLSTVNHLPARNGPVPHAPSTGKRKRASTNGEELLSRSVATPNQGHRKSSEEHNPTALAIGSTALDSPTCTSDSSEATSAKDSKTFPGSHSTSDRVPPASYHDDETEAEYDDASLDGHLANNWIAPSTTEPTGPTLCDEQAELVSLIVNGRNTFYTGSAGCGKSTVLKAFVRELRNRSKTVHIVAPTGRAALNIDGSTIWTYAGWTPNHMKRQLSTLCAAVARRKSDDDRPNFARRRLRSTDVLVIDEISMVEKWSSGRAPGEERAREMSY